MADISARIQRTVEEIMGNEALLEMLDTKAAAEKMDAVLNQVEDKTHTPHQLVLKLRQLLEEPMKEM